MRGLLAFAVVVSLGACDAYGEDEVGAPLPAREPHDASAVDEGGAVDGGASDSADGAVASGSTVKGEVVIVNAGNSMTTSVILAPEDFDPDAFHDRAPQGPKASGVTGAWSVSNVPAGTYLVLAGYENDGLVPDPGAAPVKVVVSGKPDDVVTVPGQQKLTAALSIVSITPKSTSASVTVADDPSEDGYVITVVDMMNEQVYTSEAAAASGTPNVTFAIGAALTVPLKYRVRVTAKKAGTEVRRTEDLRGLFTAAPDDT